MGTSRLNIWFRNSMCELLNDVWRTDLVIQMCSGNYLLDKFPIVDQLKKRYSKPATVVDIMDWPLMADQDGKKLELTIDTESGSGTMQSVTFATPAQSLPDIFNQLRGQFTDCEIVIEDGHLKVVTTESGHKSNITVGGDCDIKWAPVVSGTGWLIGSHYYQEANRIKIVPAPGEHVNHVECDVPPGCYKIWTRVCHGKNEETSVQMVNVRCGEEACVNLLLPTVKTCSQYVMHPLMDKIVNEQLLGGIDNHIIAFRALMAGGELGKQQVLDQLDQRLLEAQEKEDTVLEGRVNAVIAVANQLPACG